jgi:hypothetical protein
MQLYRYSVSLSSEFCRHNTLCCFSKRNTKGKRKDKGKVVTVLFLTEHHTMKAYWGSGRTDPRLGRFTPRVVLDAVVKRKIPTPAAQSIFHYRLSPETFGHTLVYQWTDPSENHTFYLHPIYLQVTTYNVLTSVLSAVSTCGNTPEAERAITCTRFKIFICV